MPADFTIDVDPARDLVAIRMAGFFAGRDLDRFLLAHALACPRLQRGHDPVTVVDIIGMHVQTQAMVARFAAVLAAPAFRSRRLAFVVGPTLARSQLRRALGSRDARCFGARADAEAWLFGDEARAA